MKTSFFTNVQSIQHRLATWERVLVVFFGCVAMFAGLALLRAGYFLITTTAPAYGGTYTEGIVGTPKFINQVLAVSNADMDVSRLVYSGLLRQQAFGSYIPDLAQSCTYNTTGTQITCTIRPQAQFHDGVPVTADDVLFTIEMIQQLGSRSPLWADVNGITLEKQDQYTLTFTLKKPYSGFDRVLTVGILPRHIWGDATIESIESSAHNITPIGSGPYQIVDVQSQDTHVTSITLKSFRNFTLQ